MSASLAQLPSDAGPVSGALRGVNLGGWLVLERWMTPALFHEGCPEIEALDERTLLDFGGEHARMLLHQHREGFIGEADFEWMANVGGIEAVRLPVGFWCLDDHAYGTPFEPSWEFVDKAFTWAHAHGLFVLLDLHGAKGSQNGKDHSGDARGQIDWLRPENRKVNLDVLEAWAKRWGQHPAFLGLGLANEVEEPALFASDNDLHSIWKRLSTAFDSLSACRLEDRSPQYDDAEDYWEDVLCFYEEAAMRVRRHMRPDAVLVVDTCWDMNRWEDGRLRELQGPIWLDYHHYQCFQEHEFTDCATNVKAEELLDRLLTDTDVPVMIGEFSIALPLKSPGCSSGGWQAPYYAKQVDHASRHAVGHFFWSYKLSRSDFWEWNYRECVERGWILPPTRTRANSGASSSELSRKAQSPLRGPISPPTSPLVMSTPAPSRGGA
eukprot:TRINITY_DN55173_c0_g1_i1.p1 TRINITY_DN55173_c0_g1~~TRINITY_DN55173_c0_g1_i1.p1  ORF type:complete len:437 (-),score=31.72 TRINITY_DN55173_c0_g1_i1:447-1757(-)